MPIIPPPSPSLTIVSWNIHRCFGTDGRYMPERICQVLDGLNADIIGLQEVDMRLLVDGRAQLEFLAESLNMHAISGPTAPERRSHFGNAILSRFPITAHERIDLSVRAFEPRGAILSSMEWHGHTLHAIVTHLGLRVKERRVQVERLIEALDRRQMGAETPLILLGDFNEWNPRAATLRDLDRRFGISSKPRTFPSRFPILPLDRLWAWPHNGVRHIEPHNDALARIASDHLPIRAIVSWDHITHNIEPFLPRKPKIDTQKADTLLGLG